MFIFVRFVPRSNKRMFNFQSASLATLRFHCYEVRRCGGPRGQAILSPLDDDGDCFNAGVDDDLSRIGRGIPALDAHIQLQQSDVFQSFFMQKPPVLKWKETKTY